MKPLACTLLLAAVVSFGTAVSVAGDKKGAEVDFDGLKSRAPAEWKAEAAKGFARYVQFRLPKAQDAAPIPRSAWPDIRISAIWESARFLAFPGPLAVTAGMSKCCNS